MYEDDHEETHYEDYGEEEEYPVEEGKDPEGDGDSWAPRDGPGAPGTCKSPLAEYSSCDTEYVIKEMEIIMFVEFVWTKDNFSQLSVLPGKTQHFEDWGYQDPWKN